MKPELKDVSFAAVFGAVALALPTLFHAVGLGSAFLPMFLPLAAAGFLLPFRVAAPLAVIVPAVSFKHHDGSDDRSPHRTHHDA
jgi:hypothetical protein